jgi:hypothetical protein
MARLKSGPSRVDAPRDEVVETLAAALKRCAIQNRFLRK